MILIYIILITISLHLLLNVTRYPLKQSQINKLIKINYVNQSSHYVVINLLVDRQRDVAFIKCKNQKYHIIRLQTFPLQIN